MACWILVPPTRIEPTAPAVEAQSLNLWTPKELHSLGYSAPCEVINCLAGSAIITARLIPEPSEEEVLASTQGQSAAPTSQRRGRYSAVPLSIT